MKVAAIQMVSGTQWQANLLRAQALMRQAADEEAELVVLPEYFCLLGMRDTDKLAIQEAPGDGPIQAFLAESARALDLWVVGGTLPLSVAPDAPVEAAARVYNSTLVYSPQGDCVARYDKIHLFRFDNGRERYDESRVLLSGTQPVTFDLPSRDGHRWRLGLSVCYDLRFPELYRAYAQAGADLLLVPSAFTHTTGQAHWDVLLRSRAVENLAFVLAAAQGGLHENGRRTWGHSMLVDPWGHVMAEQAEGEAVVMAELRPELLQQCRLQLPALEHRVL
ncbi:MAG: acyltransferase [Curvibacter sp. PD_MW3]|nr:MAG: acyltransferase [Curvibacter sp. PD_MW3]